jgi:thymidylate synthase
MTLPPCHYGFQCYTRELTIHERSMAVGSNHQEIYQNCAGVGVDVSDTIHKHLDTLNAPKRELSLQWNQRSVDTFLGLPFNIASYAFLLEMLAQQSNMIPGELIGNLGDTHLYLNHIEPTQQQLKAESFALPTLVLNKAATLFDYKHEDFSVEGYTSSATIKAPLNN